MDMGLMISTERTKANLSREKLAQAAGELQELLNIRKVVKEK